MAGITQTIPSFIAGMSEQPDTLKLSGQIRESINAVPDVTKGLFKRPGSQRVSPDTNPLTNVQSGGSWFHYYRDASEGAYIGQVAADGQVRLWSCKNGKQMDTLYGAAAWVSTVEYEAGQRVQANNKIYEAQDDISSGGSAPSHSSGTTNNWLFIEATLTSQTKVQNYLATSAPENLQFLTINDTTFVNSRDTTNANTIVGMTGTTDARPHAHFGFIELLRSENGRQYGINLHGSNTTASTLTRATRIKIESDTLDESDGTGHCPGIGTQVFSVTAASSYTDPTIVSVAAAKRSTGLVPDTQIYFGATAIIGYGNLVGTGLPTGTPVVYTATNTSQQIPNLSSGTTYYVVTYTQTDGNSTNYFRVATTATNAANGTFIAIGNPASGSTHTFTEAAGQAYTSGKDNLIFRLNTLGQQGVSPDYNAGQNGPGGDDYRCSYNREAVLLHGGEGWITGDTVTVTMDSASTSYNYTIRIEDHETTQLNATVVNAGDGIIRPEPTPFDADTAVTTDTIVGGIIQEINKISNNTIQAEQVGSGIYVHSASPFTLEVVEDDLMRCFQSSVNDVSKLPNQCKHGYIVKVSNALRSEEDDYYLRFNGENKKSGSGSWTECALPGITKTLTNMPLAIQRTALNTSTGVATFTVRPFVYKDREVGDLVTNPNPSFVGKRINKVLFFRNRIVFLSESNVISSRPGSAGNPDFFIETALTVSASDPIDISAASMFPSELFDGIEVSTGLVVFSTNQQFLLSADDTVLNPDTAKLRSISTFNYNKNIPPISLGTTISYIDNSGKFSRLNEMANIRREGEPNVVEVSKVIPTTLPKDIDLLTNSRENSIILTGKTGSNIVTGYRYFQVAENRQQAAWFKWKFNKSLLYHFIRDDEYVFLDSNNFLQKIKLVQDDDPSVVDENEINYLLHLDNNTTIAGGQFSETTNTTTFSNVVWLDNVTSPIYTVAIVDSQGRYGVPTVNTGNNTLTLTGDWSNSTLPSGDTSFTVGYTYDYEVKFPTIYPNTTVGGKRVADINSSLVLHRIKLHFGKIGSYKTTLNRVGKKSFTDQYESTQVENYDAGDVPYLSQFIKTVPIYERNVNVDIVLKSTHPSPATLHSLSWEGDYSPKYYKRV